MARLVSNARYEEIRLIGAEVIEDYCISYPFDPLNLLEKLDITIKHTNLSPFLNITTFPEEDICGYTLMRKVGKTITYQVSINERQSEERKRFTAAHELAHILLDHKGELEIEKEEQEANFLASFLLAPEILVNKFVPNLSVPSISSIFNVSVTAAEHISKRTTWHNNRQTSLQPYEKIILDGTEQNNGLMKLRKIAEEENNFNESIQKLIPSIS